jgi:F-type H+-transporting ATPase subunit delta
MAILSNNDIARAIYSSTLNKSLPEQGVVLKNAVAMLYRRRLMSRSGAILKALKKISNNENGILEARVWSRNKIEPNDKKELISLLKEKYGNKEIVLEERLDEGVIGGFRIEIGDELIDLTLKNKIYQLQAYLNKNYE